MSEPTTEGRRRKLRLRRALLRALNGAGLGIVLGGILGVLLGGLFAAMLMGNPHHPAPEMALWGGFFGAFPGAFGGFWIGMTAAIPDGRRGVIGGLQWGCAWHCSSW